VVHDALCGDGGHIFIGLMDALTALEPQRECDRVGKIAGIGGVSFSLSSAIAGE
jgi:hypothetical protein